MRVLFILENYHPHIGGVEIVFRNLASGLAKRGYGVTVLTRRLPGTRRTETLDGVRIARVWSGGTRYLFTFTAIPAALRLARDADVIHTTTFNGAPPAWLAARVRGKPGVLTVHETWLGKWREYTDFGPVRAWLHELLERCVFLPRYDRYVCVSDATRSALGAALPKTRSRALTIRNGFDPAHWKRPRAAAKRLRRQYGLDGKFVVLGYGRPGASKGFEHLIAAFHLVKKKLPNARLVLILSTDKQYAHKIQAFRRDAPADTLFLQPQKYADLPAHVQMADCVVVPSLSEGFGYAVLESVAAGTPVVASDTTSIPEVIHGKHVLVKPGNPRSIADGIVEVARGRWEETPEKRFPWSENIERHEKLYRALAEAFDSRR